ncbi:response regulator transcription factor [Stackebrandtia nassauensis]|uniref:Two component transcriptional regulator, LuxR family n=1 Tax=Stackebrandtia nassauensis (strain DSM 44728 / CIP 108903 / NRRL B-16338 / NBRC 102104 / LLR-40K-21) TaxID=446470 RepID=D3Q1Q0_STANL|nr:response regulator transcription factor [Stackebrandtia nassauensis]ADD39898.1 two component transcriptional regulator, LuxR family [Stackebrandtia nassauensis DSM 44728]
MDVTTTSVLLVDDDPMVRNGLRMVLRADPGIVVVGEAGNGRQAVDQARELRPDVVLMDLQMPVMDGVAATRELRGLPDAPAVLVLTTFHLDTYILDALGAGASGYLLKDIPPTEIARAVQMAAAGESVFSSSVTRSLVQRVASPATDPKIEAARAALAALTEREREVAAAVAAGKSNAAIASEMFMSEATVKTHVSRILTKTRSQNRVQIALTVYRASGVR